MGMISDFNMGDLKKIGWGRATRTDKKVHALTNTFSAKVLTAKKPVIITKDADGKVVDRKSCSLEEHLDDLRQRLNNEDGVLPNDIKIFSLLPVSNRFNAKNCTSYREYSYFLPTFMLTSIKQLYLLTPPRTTTIEEQKEEETKQTVVKQVTTGVKKIIRQAGVEDEHEEEGAVHASRPINHISDDTIDQMYRTRLTETEKESLHNLWANFEGTKKYHNYTKEIKPHETAS